MYTIHRNDAKQIQYTVEPEKGYTRQDIVQALQAGAAKVQGEKIILTHADSEGKVMGLITEEDIKSSTTWS